MPALLAVSFLRIRTVLARCTCSVARSALLGAGLRRIPGHTGRSLWFCGGVIILLVWGVKRIKPVPATHPVDPVTLDFQQLLVVSLLVLTLCSLRIMVKIFTRSATGKVHSVSRRAI